MSILDIGVIALLAVGAWQGARRGLAWQLAPIASLILGYVVAYPLSEKVAPGWGDDPSARYWALLGCYFVVSLGVYMVARLLRESIEAMRMQEFDRHLGALFGVVKSALLCLVVMFFAVGMSQQTREFVLGTTSGKTAGYVMHQIEPILPPSMHDFLEPYMAELPSEPPTFDFKPVEQKIAADEKGKTQDETRKQASPFIKDVLRMVDRQKRENQAK